jgi:hypothetical protein
MGLTHDDLSYNCAVVITKDGVPRSMVPTSEATLLEDVQELVFARARKAVRAIRTRASEIGTDRLSRSGIEKEIRGARQSLKQRARRG